MEPYYPVNDKENSELYAQYKNLADHEEDVIFGGRLAEYKFVENVIGEMERWMFLKMENETHQIKICPLTGKIQGSYPSDFIGGRDNEQ